LIFDLLYPAETGHKKFFSRRLKSNFLFERINNNSAISYQLSAICYQLSAFSYQLFALTTIPLQRLNVLSLPHVPQSNTATFIDCLHFLFP